MTIKADNLESTTSWSSPAVLRQRLSTFPVAPDLAYFELEVAADFEETASASLRARFTPAPVFGFARPGDLEAFKRNEAQEIPRVNVRIVPPGFREAMQRQLFMDALEEYQNDFTKPCSRIEDLRAGNVSLDDIVTLDIGSHLLFDRFGDPLPVGILFDYVNGPIKESSYDLDGALEILLKDPRVIPFRSKRQPAQGGLRVTRVGDLYPGDDEQYVRHIRFIFAPTADDIKAIWAKCQSYDTTYPFSMRRQAVLDLDLLGLQSCRLVQREGACEDAE